MIRSLYFMYVVRVTTMLVKVVQGQKDKDAEVGGVEFSPQSKKTTK